MCSSCQKTKPVLTTLLPAPTGGVRGVQILTAVREGSPGLASMRAPVVVTDAAGKRLLLSAAQAAALVARDPRARVVKARTVVRSDGTLAGPPAFDEVHLSGLFSSIGRVIGGVAKGTVKGIRTVGAKIAPIAGAGVGFVVGGPAGAAAGAQIGNVVREGIRHRTGDEVLARKAGDLANRAARLGIQLEESQALWLAGQPPAEVESWFVEAKRLQDQAQAGRFVDAVGAGSATGYAPSVGAFQSAASRAAAAAAEALQAQPPPVATASVGGSLFSSPIVLGGLGLAAVLLLKK